STFVLVCGYAPHRDLHSFPTRRSSDLGWGAVWTRVRRVPVDANPLFRGNRRRDCHHLPGRTATNWLIQPEFRGRTHADSTRQSRSEEHTSELQSRENLVCRLLLEKKKK